MSLKQKCRNIRSIHCLIFFCGTFFAFCHLFKASIVGLTHCIEFIGCRRNFFFVCDFPCPSGWLYFVIKSVCSVYDPISTKFSKLFKSLSLAKLVHHFTREIPSSFAPSSFSFSHSRSHVNWNCTHAIMKMRKIKNKLLKCTQLYYIWKLVCTVRCTTIKQNVMSFKDKSFNCGEKSAWNGATKPYREKQTNIIKQCEKKSFSYSLEMKMFN